MIFNLKERKVRNHVCSLFYNMIVLDWLMGSNILEELASSPTTLKMEAASSMKHLYLSCTSLHGVMSQKTGIFIRIRVRTSNLTNLFIAFFFFLYRILVLDYHFSRRTVIILSLVHVILTITAVSHSPTWYRTVKLSFAYCRVRL